VVVTVVVVAVVVVIGNTDMDLDHWKCHTARTQGQG
jgi:hypothetical protein